MFAFLCKVHFMEHYILQVHACCCKLPVIFHHFHGRVIFHCVHVSRLFYPFPVDTSVGLLLAVVNGAAVNVGVQKSLSHTDIRAFGLCSHHGIVGS